MIFCKNRSTFAKVIKVFHLDYYKKHPVCTSYQELCNYMFFRAALPIHSDPFRFCAMFENISLHLMHMGKRGQNERSVRDIRTKYHLMAQCKLEFDGRLLEISVSFTLNFWRPHAKSDYLTCFSNSDNLNTVHDSGSQTSRCGPLRWNVLGCTRLASSMRFHLRKLNQFH